ncbi:MAG: hypothetical protein ACTSVI_13425 [Promethearchaeota archaeon]
MSDEHGGKQMSSFLIKKGDYLCDLATTHSKASEHDKAADLFLKAAGWYKKGGNQEKMKEAIQKAKEEKQKIPS